MQNKGEILQGNKIIKNLRYPCDTWLAPGGFRGAWISGVM
jgi:hypothetical protein